MDIPEPMIDSQVNNMVNDYARRMQSQGLSLEQYMQFTGMTIETLKEQMKPQAVKRIQTRLVLEAIVKAENITMKLLRKRSQIWRNPTRWKLPRLRNTWVRTASSR